jgi:L-rhamnose mutarotase
MLYLKDDPDAIARYEDLHREIRPEVACHFHDHGVIDTLISAWIPGCGLAGTP